MDPRFGQTKVLLVYLALANLTIETDQFGRYWSLTRMNATKPFALRIDSRLCNAPYSVYYNLVELIKRDALIPYRVPFHVL